MARNRTRRYYTEKRSYKNKTLRGIKKNLSTLSPEMRQEAKDKGLDILYGRYINYQNKHKDVISPDWIYYNDYENFLTLRQIAYDKLKAVNRIAPDVSIDHANEIILHALFEEMNPSVSDRNTWAQKIWEGTLKKYAAGETDENVSENGRVFTLSYQAYASVSRTRTVKKWDSITFSSLEELERKLTTYRPQEIGAMLAAAGYSHAQINSFFGY